MDKTYIIRDLEGLLGLKLRPGESLSYVARQLNPAGENYGSTMLSLDVTIAGGDETKRCQYVAKMCPPTAMMKEMFDTPVTYKKELALYTKIVPALQKFQKENGVPNVIDFFSTVHGARISLDPKADIVDDDAALVFTNLKFEGFELVDRMKGFDFECASLILRDLAAFHAVPLALKIRHSNRFDEEVLSHISETFKFNLNEEIMNDFWRRVKGVLAADEHCAQFVDRADRAIAIGTEYNGKRPSFDEATATLTHNDFWVNNTMLKFENGKPVKNVMVDFQIIDYGSAADDVVFFLFTSVQSKVVERHYDELIDVYFSTFLETLRQLRCDTSAFTPERFAQELANSAKTRQFFHVMVMLSPIFTRRGKVKELSELTEDDLMQDDDTLADEYPEKLRHVVREFAKRNWI